MSEAEKAKLKKKKKIQ